MDILIVMCIGILVGKFIPKGKDYGINGKIQLICTILLIFAMGVMLGAKENFTEQLLSLGLTSFLFFLIPTGLSVLFVYSLTKFFMEKHKNTPESKEAE